MHCDALHSRFWMSACWCEAKSVHFRALGLLIFHIIRFPCRRLTAVDHQLVAKKHLSVEQHLNPHGPCEPETVHLDPTPRGGIQARMPVRARMVAVGVQLPLVPERVGPQHEAQPLARLGDEREQMDACLRCGPERAHTEVVDASGLWGHVCAAVVDGACVYILVLLVVPLNLYKVLNLVCNCILSFFFCSKPAR
jgi:hypothetical protein